MLVDAGLHSKVAVHVDVWRTLSAAMDRVDQVCLANCCHVPSQVTSDSA